MFRNFPRSICKNYSFSVQKSFPIKRGCSTVAPPSNSTPPPLFTKREFRKLLANSNEQPLMNFKFDDYFDGSKAKDIFHVTEGGYVEISSEDFAKYLPEGISKDFEAEVDLTQTRSWMIRDSTRLLCKILDEHQSLQNTKPRTILNSTLSSINVPNLTDREEWLDSKLRVFRFGEQVFQRGDGDKADDENLQKTFRDFAQAEAERKNPSLASSSLAAAASKLSSDEEDSDSSDSDSDSDTDSESDSEEESRKNSKKKKSAPLKASVALFESESEAPVSYRFIQGTNIEEAFARLSSSTASSSPSSPPQRILLTGPRGSGKSYSLAQSVLHARKNGWLVMYVPHGWDQVQSGWFVEPMYPSLYGKDGDPSQVSFDKNNNNNKKNNKNKKNFDDDENENEEEENYEHNNNVEEEEGEGGTIGKMSVEDELRESDYDQWVKDERKKKTIAGLAFPPGSPRLFNNTFMTCDVLRGFWHAHSTQLRSLPLQFPERTEKYKPLFANFMEQYQKLAVFPGNEKLDFLQMRQIMEGDDNFPHQDDLDRPILVGESRSKGNRGGGGNHNKSSSTSSTSTSSSSSTTTTTTTESNNHHHHEWSFDITKFSFKTMEDLLLFGLALRDYSGHVFQDLVYEMRELNLPEMPVMFAIDQCNTWEVPSVYQYDNNPVLGKELCVPNTLNFISLKKAESENFTVKNGLCLAATSHRHTEGKKLDFYKNMASVPLTLRIPSYSQLEFLSALSYYHKHHLIEKEMKCSEILSYRTYTASIPGQTRQLIPNFMVSRGAKRDSGLTDEEMIARAEKQEIELERMGIEGVDVGPDEVPDAVMEKLMFGKK